MIKEIKKLTKNKLDLNNLADKNLSIQLSLDGFSFCVYIPHSLEVVHFGSYEFSDNHNNSPYKQLELVEKLFENELILNNQFNNINVAHLNNLVAHVPNPIFNKEELSSYLKYSVKVLENDFIACDEIKNTEIVTVYIPFVNINNFLFDKYGSFNYQHSSSILIEKLLTQNKHVSKTTCFVNVSASIFEIVVLKNNSLILYNLFNYKTKEDFIYYILFVSEQLGLNPEEFELYLMGDIDKDSELFSIVYKYIRNVQFYKNETNQLQVDLPLHSHYTLLNTI